MAIFVFFVNLIVAAFTLAVITEISLVLVGGLVYAYKALSSKSH